MARRTLSEPRAPGRGPGPCLRASRPRVARGPGDPRGRGGGPAPSAGQAARALSEAVAHRCGRTAAQLHRGRGDARDACGEHRPDPWPVPGQAASRADAGGGNLMTDTTGAPRSDDELLDEVAQLWTRL